MAFRLLYLIAIRVFGWHADLGPLPWVMRSWLWRRTGVSAMTAPETLCFLDTGIG